MIRIFKHYISTAYFYLLIIEWMIFALALYLGSVTRFSDTNSWYSDEQIFNTSIVFAFVFSISCSAFGLYRRTLDQEDFMLLERIFFACALATFLLAFIYYIFPQFFLARSVMLYAVGFAFASLWVSRFLFYRLVDINNLKRRILVIGSGVRANQIREFNSSYVHKGFEIVGFICMENETPMVNDPIYLQTEGDIVKISEQLSVDEIVVAIDDRRKRLPVEELLDIKMSGVQVLDLQTFYEREQRLVFLESLTPSWLVFSDGFENSGLRPIFKRAFDILASILLLLVSWWVMLLTALAICIECKACAPVLYRQVRVGERNRLFEVIKFRSMYLDAEKNGAEWARKNDDRVTKVGKFIRKSRIDELPQLFNVLKGDMSFVGPRPERPEFVSGFEKNIPYYKERHRVKPGITGWAQLCYPYGSSEHDTKCKLEYDLYYVKNYSMFLDLTIILSTIEVVLWGKGAR